MKFIQYNLSGEVVEENEFTMTSFKANPIGQKVRITTNAGKVYVGFWDTIISGQLLPKQIKISRYDLDNLTGKLKTSKNITDFVPINEISKIEAILHSNPCWGTRPTNKFAFFKPIRIDQKIAFFKKRSKK